MGALATANGAAQRAQDDGMVKRYALPRARILVLLWGMKEKKKKEEVCSFAWQH
jgi:hypothetical protein